VPLTPAQEARSTGATSARRKQNLVLLMMPPFLVMTAG
jgi:hypothetical protein